MRQSLGLLGRLALAFLLLDVCSSFRNDLDGSDEEFQKDPILNYSALENPFRVQKINLLWEKARLKLNENKLTRLFSELKVLDKEHLALKRLKADNGDKDGLREAEIRKKFNGVMYGYGIVNRPENESNDIKESYVDSVKRGLFKDKKLDKLWQKAQNSGLTEEELIVLKSEFMHHQEKVEEYHKLKEMSHAIRDDGKPNEIHMNADETPDHLNPNTLDGKSKSIKDNYERLHRLALNSHPRDFEEPKVDGLWKLAQTADFSPEELESIRIELKHYEQRIKKLHHLKAELKLVDSRHEKAPEKSDGRKKLDSKLWKHADAVDKMHQDLVAKIAARHSEL